MLYGCIYCLKKCTFQDPFYPCWNLFDTSIAFTERLRLWVCNAVLCMDTNVRFVVFSSRSMVYIYIDIWPFFTHNCIIVLWGCVLSWMAFGLHKVHTHLPCSSISDWCWLEKYQFSQAKAKFAWSAQKLLPVRIHIGIRTQIFRWRCDAKNISDLYLDNICHETVPHLSVSFGQITHGFAFCCNTCYLPLS